MLTNETIKKLRLEQEKLDQFIIQKNNIADNYTKASFNSIKIALLVEIGELANELKTFKHWKSHKEVNWEKAKEELIDCLHFYLSWANSFQIDFSDYKFRQLTSEPSYNELLLALFSETESFITEIPWNKFKQKLLAINEKSWEDYMYTNKSTNLKSKITEKDIEDFKKIKEEQKKAIEKMNNSFFAELEVEKNKTSFYRWLLIFEELAQKLGMKNEKDIEEAYLKKNKINWKRQQENY